MHLRTLFAAALVAMPVPTLAPDSRPVVAAPAAAAEQASTPLNGKASLAFAVAGAMLLVVVAGGHSRRTQF